MLEKSPPIPVTQSSTALNLISLKRTPAEKKAEKSLLTPNPVDGDEFPWEMRLHLDNALMEKLQLSPGLAVGTTLSLIAEGKVESVTQRDNVDGKNNSITIQLTAANFTPNETARTAETEGAKLFGNE